MSYKMRTKAVVTAGLCAALAGGAMLAPAVALAEDAPIEQDVDAGDPSDSSVSAVALVNGEECATLEDIVDAIAAADKADVKLMDSVEFDEVLTIDAGKVVSLDMNGKSITVSSDFSGGRPITNKGTLTVTGNGTIDCSGAGDKAVGAIRNDGVLTIMNGTFDGGNDYGNGGVIRNGSSATLTIFGGTFQNGTAAIYNANEAYIYGGTFIGDTCSACNGVWGYTIQNGSIDGSSPKMIVEEKDPENNPIVVLGTQGALSASAGYLEVTGGTYETRDCDKKHGAVFYALYVAGEDADVKAVINDGVFVGGKRTAVLVGNDNTNGDGGINANATSEIRGGSFTAPDGVPAITGAPKTGNPIITGGVFSSEVDEAYFAKGYEAVQDPETGKYVVSMPEEKRVAEIDGKYYLSLEDAVADAESGDTISLLSSATISSAITIDKPVNIVGNGKEITSTVAGGRFFALSGDAASLSIDGAVIAVPKNAVPVTTPTGKTVPIAIKNCTIKPKDDTGCIVNFAQGGPVKFEFAGNTVDVSARGLLVNVSNGSKITGNTIDLKGEQTLAKDNRTGIISLVATAGGEGVEISGNTFKNANRCLGVDHSTLEASQITFKKNKFVDVRFVLEFDPAFDGSNAATGTYNVNYNYYNFGGEVSASKIEDASSKGNHLDGTTEYKPTEGASRVDNSVYYLRDTMLDSDLNTYVPPVTPPTTSDKTEVEHNQDGSTTTTVTKPDGSQTITHETATGTESVVTKDEDGNVTSTEVTVSKQDAESGRVELPIAGAEPAADAEKAPAVEVKVPAAVTAEKPVQVTVPVAKGEGDEPNYGIVVFAVDAEGNETVIPKCSVDKDGNVVFEASGDVTIKVVDAVKDMPDVKDSDWFAGDVVDFATARGIVNGVDMPDGSKQFQGYGGTSRGMLVAMLHNLEMNPGASGNATLPDVPANAFYAGAAAWALEEGILSGVDMPDGTKQFQGEAAVTREQVAVFLMRYAQHLGMDVSARAEIDFPDASEVSGFAKDAMSWAVAEGLFTGDDVTGELNPTDGAARAEVAAVLMRFINLMYA